MAPTQEESKLEHLLKSETSSTASLHSSGDENDPNSVLTMLDEENYDEKFESILEKASTAFPSKSTLLTIIREAAGVGGASTADVRSLKFQVIGREVCLQHLPIYAPKLNQLILDGSALHSLRDLGSGLRNLRHLSVNHCGLNSLDGIMSLLTLEELHTEGNKLRDLSGCLSLNEVKRINGKSNIIQDLTTISLLAFCEKLEWLDIENNPFIEDNAGYVIQIKAYLPQLQKLDSVNLIPCTTKASKNSAPTCTSRLPVIAECSLPTIEVPPEKALRKRPHTTLPNCSYTVKFTPQPLSPRASSARASKTRDIESQRFELPKL